MLATRKISCPLPAAVRKPRRNFAALFERWLGYSLHPHARRLIAELERQRARRMPQRLYVSDSNAESGLLQRALVDYVRWLTIVVRPTTNFCVIAPSRAQLKSLVPRHPDIITATARSPEYVRGLNFPMALILDADRYPKKGRHLTRILRSVSPIIYDGPGTLLVIHGTPHPRMRVNTFTNELRRTTNPIPLITPSEAEPPDNPDGTTQDCTVTVHIPTDVSGNEKLPQPPNSSDTHAFLP